MSSYQCEDAQLHLRVCVECDEAFDELRKRLAKAEAERDAYLADDGALTLSVEYSRHLEAKYDALAYAALCVYDDGRGDEDPCEGLGRVAGEWLDARRKIVTLERELETLRAEVVRRREDMAKYETLVLVDQRREIAESERDLARNVLRTVRHLLVDMLASRRLVRDDVFEEAIDSCEAAIKGKT